MVQYNERIWVHPNAGRQSRRVRAHLVPSTPRRDDLHEGQQMEFEVAAGRNGKAAAANVKLHRVVGHGAASTAHAGPRRHMRIMETQMKHPANLSRCNRRKAKLKAKRRRQRARA
jgi:hypothetical protein